MPDATAPDVGAPEAPDAPEVPDAASETGPGSAGPEVELEDDALLDDEELLPPVLEELQAEISRATADRPAMPSTAPRRRPDNRGEKVLDTGSPISRLASR